MIYVYNNVIHYYGECDLDRRKILVGAHLVMWSAKLGNKYWKKGLVDNTHLKIKIHEDELEKLKGADKCK